MSSVRDAKPLVCRSAIFATDQRGPEATELRSNLCRRLRARIRVRDFRPLLVGTASYTHRGLLRTETPGQCRQTSDLDESDNFECLIIEGSRYTSRRLNAVSCVRNAGPLVDRSTSFATNQNGPEATELRSNLSRRIRARTRVRDVRPRLVGTASFPDRGLFQTVFPGRDRTTHIWRHFAAFVQLA